MFVDHKSAWTVNEANKYESEWIYRLTESDIKELIEATEGWVLGQRPVDEITKDNFPLPGLSEKLNQIANDVESGFGFCLLKGVPVEDLTYEECTIMYAGLGSYLGTPIAQSIENELIHEVFSKGEALTSEKGRGTQTCDYLPFHTDRADVVGLLCLNKAKEGGQSRIVSAVSVYNEIYRLRPDLLELLCQNFENIRAPWEPKFDGLTYPIPVFSIYKGNFACRYLRNFIHYAQSVEGGKKLSELQIEALDMIDELCRDERFCLEIPFEPGDIQFVNNFVTLHGRSEYSDHESPHLKRFLLRLWLASPISRDLSPAFKPLYGNVKGGSLRGGMLAQELEKNKQETCV